MKLLDALKDCDVKILGEELVEVKGVDNNSRNIKENDIFVAIDGANTKGINYLKSAIENGAGAAVVDSKYYLDILDKIKEDEIYGNISYVFSKNVLKDMARISKSVYGNSSKDLILIGITGTKGKTTTASIIKEILRSMDENVLLIGTNGAYINEKEVFNTGRTTLESFENERLFKLAKEQNVKYAVLEVSSQAMIKQRLFGTEFNEMTFTNFSEEHISPNEHPNIESYFDAKIMAMDLSDTNIINLDDEWVKKTLDVYKDKKHITFGKSEKANIQFKENSIKKDAKWEVDIEIKKGIYEDKYIGKYKLINNIPGMYSIYNSLAIIANLINLNIPMDKILKGLENASVNGRFEEQKNPLDLKIYIDFAHNEASYRKILETGREITKGRLITVWGADTGRDKTKRAPMGKVVDEYADINLMCPCDFYDNEPFESVLNDMLEGIENPKDEKNKTFDDREEAIRYAIDIMKPEDTLFVLGKDHGRTIIKKGKEESFNERAIIQDAVRKKMAKK